MTDESQFIMYWADDHVGRIVVKTGMFYGLWTTMHGNLNAQRWDLEAHCGTFHPPPSVHLSAWQCMAKSRYFGVAQNVPVFPRPAYSPYFSCIDHIWDALVQHVQQVPKPNESKNLMNPYQLSDFHLFIKFQ